MEKRELFRNLVVMAASDGSLTESEIQLLSARAKTWDIDEQEFAHMIEFALQPESHVDVPPQRDARVRLLKELIRMMAADGRLAEPEKRIFATVAAVMKFSDDEINSIIDETLEA
jgi:uncharacterized tellurite resistance protein B-like protein